VCGQHEVMLETWSNRRRSVECAVRHCTSSANARKIKQGIVLFSKGAMNLNWCLEIETGWRRICSVTKNFCYGALQGTGLYDAQQKRGSVDEHSMDIV
jgi:hypothetical protein